MTKEEIIEVLKEELGSIYCYNCQHEGKEEPCEWCHRKYMQWQPSEGLLSGIADRISGSAEKKETIESLGLTKRTFTCLKKRDIQTIEDLCTLTEEDLLRTRNLGVKAKEEIVTALAKRGLTLKNSHEKNVRLIDANALIDEIDGDLMDGIAERRAIEKILNAPTITTEAVRHGHWIHTGRTNIYGGHELECSECGDKVMVQHIEDEHYCRNCGAKNGKEAE